MNSAIKLTRNKYIIFLFLVIIFIAANQSLLYYSLGQQKNNSKLINTAGRQRMISQKIVKTLLYINYHENDNYNHAAGLDDLKKSLKEWENGEKYLINSYSSAGSTIEIDKLLATTSQMRSEVKLAAYAYINNPTKTQLLKTISIVESLEENLLINMEKVVLAFQKKAETKLNQSSFFQLILSLFSIIVLLINFKYSLLPVIHQLFTQSKKIEENNELLEKNEQEIKHNLDELNLLSEKLKERELNNKIFIEQAPGAIAMFNNNMEYLAASKNWITDYHLEGQEIIGKSHYEIFPEIDEVWKKIHQDCLAGATNICEEAAFPRADGSTQWLSWEVKPWYSANGKIGGLIMYTNDITKIKERDFEKLRIQDILNTTNKIARIGTWDVDLVRGKVHWSDITKEIHEVEPDYVPNLETGINFYKEGKSREIIQNAVSKVIAEGTPFDVELEIVSAKNNVIWVRSIGQAEMVNGKCVRFFGVFQDIDFIKRAEEKIIRTNNELNAILNSGPISIISTDINGVISHFNTGAERLLGYCSEEVVGKFTPAIIHVEEEVKNRGVELSEEYKREIVGFEVFIVKAIENGFDERRWTYIRKDGTTFPVNLLVTTIRNLDHEIVGYLGVGTDITERVAAEKEILNSRDSLELLTKQLTAQNNQLASFAHITSHNLRSPVSNLTALLYFYKNATTEEDKAELMEKFEIVIQHLTSTLNTLVDTLKIQADTNHVLEELKFSDILEKTKQILSGQIMETNATITADFKVENVIYDRTYLESIFLNLISNSIKYSSPVRPLKINVASEIENNRIRFSVADNGLGIDLTRHGEKLFGLNKTFHRHPEAKGIGLYLTKTQIESLGGSITAVSNIDQGITFLIDF